MTDPKTMPSVALSGSHVVVCHLDDTDPCRGHCAECSGSLYCQPWCECGCRTIDDLYDTLTVALSGPLSVGG